MRTLMKPILILCLIPFLGAADCGNKEKPVCGDNYCEGNETTRSCPLDCGSDCGDGTCNGNETTSSCSIDCGEPPPVCGDGRCSGGETRTSCPEDCGNPPSCGDGSCNGSETTSSCPQDCGSGPEPRVFSCGGQTGTCQLLQNYGNCCGGYWVECPAQAGHFCAADGLCYPTHCPASDFCSYTGVPCSVSGVTASSKSADVDAWDPSTAAEPIFIDEMNCVP